MSDHVYGAFYGSNSRKPKGNGARKSINGNLQVGNGNLTPRRRMGSNGGMNGGGIERGWFSNLMNLFIPEPCHCTDAQGMGFTTQCPGNKKNQDCVACCGSLNGVPAGSGNGQIRRVRRRR